MSKQDTRQDEKGHKPNQTANKGNENARQPDPETLGTTDPQEHMHGPISNLMQKVKDGAEENDQHDRENVEEEVPDERKVDKGKTKK